MRVFKASLCFVLIFSAFARNATADDSAAVSKEVTITRGKPLVVNIPSLPADQPTADVVDKTLPVQLMDVQLSNVFQSGVGKPIAQPPSGPKRLMISQRNSAADILKPKLASPTPLKVSVGDVPQAQGIYQPPTLVEPPSQAPVAIATPGAASVQTTYVPPMPVAPKTPVKVAPPLSVASFIAALSAIAPVPAQEAVVEIPYVAPQAIAPVAQTHASTVTLAELAPAAGAPAPLVATDAAEPLPEPVDVTGKAPPAPPPAPVAATPPPAPAVETPPPAPALATAPVSVVSEPQQVVDQALKSPAPSTAVAATPIATPDPKLSKDSKKTLSKIPAGVDTPKEEKTEHMTIGREHKTNEVFDASTSEASPKNNRLDIMVKKPGLDIGYELEKAYNALINGETSVAVEIYKNALGTEPENVQAKLGLAIAYHRAGQFNLARPLYADVLTKDPTNRDALNNFLGLVAEEAPDEALGKLQTLMVRNPDFSAIPAQMAVIYQKKGDYVAATQSMSKAVSLAPENLSYKYNLAVMFDKMGKKDEASSLYSNILDAYMRGETLGVNIKAVQDRLTFLRSNR